MASWGSSPRVQTWHGQSAKAHAASRSQQLACECVQERHSIFHCELLSMAYMLAAKAHAGQLRKDGTSQLSHGVMTALQLAELGLDAETVAAGLLHQVRGMEEWREWRELRQDRTGAAARRGAGGGGKERSVPAAVTAALCARRSSGRLDSTSGRARGSSSDGSSVCGRSSELCMGQQVQRHQQQPLVPPPAAALWGQEQQHAAVLALLTRKRCAGRAAKPGAPAHTRPSRTLAVKRVCTQACGACRHARRCCAPTRASAARWRSSCPAA